MIVHANAVPAGPIPLQGFKAIPRGQRKVVEPARSVQQPQLPLHASPQGLRNPSGGARVPVSEQIGRRLVAKRLNHTTNILHV